MSGVRYNQRYGKTINGKKKLQHSGAASISSQTRISVTHCSVQPEIYFPVQAGKASLHLTSTSPKLSISRLCQLLSFRGCVFDDSVCSPIPAASQHFTATSRYPCIFRDGFLHLLKPICWFLNVNFDFFVFSQTRGLGVQVKTYYRCLLSLATSIFRYALVFLVYQFTVEYLPGCNRLSPFGV